MGPLGLERGSSVTGDPLHPAQDYDVLARLDEFARLEDLSLVRTLQG